MFHLSLKMVSSRSACFYLLVSLDVFVEVFECVVIFLTCSSHILSSLWHSAWPQSEHPVAQQSLLTFDLSIAARRSDRLCWISIWKRQSVLDWSGGVYPVQITKKKKHQANKTSCFRPIWPAFTPESWRSAEETERCFSAFPFVRWFQGVWFEAAGCSRAGFPPLGLFKAQ